MYKVAQSARAQEDRSTREETEKTHIDLQVEGMTCTNCALSIEKYLKKEGLDQVHVDFANEEVSFELEAPKALPQIINGINKLGFKVVEEEVWNEQGKWSKVEKLFGVALLFTIPLLLHMFLPVRLLHNPYFQLAMALPVYAIGFYHFGLSAWKSSRAGVLNMDVLIITGATAAFGYSLYGTLTQAGSDFLFYETAASIITIVLLGNVIEHRAVKKTTTAVKSLNRLKPHFVKRIEQTDSGEKVVQVSINEINKGDLIQVNTGDKIPIDGEIYQGYGEVNEAMLTGESLPVSKQVGDKVLGGTILLDGNLNIRSERIGKATTLAQIIDMVKKAQADKPHIQRLADQISAIFVPAVMGIALLTFILSYWVADISLESSIIHSVAVLVISCPCAMGLATPTAVVVGIGRASRNGILIKGGRTLEQLAQVTYMVFDKTGTLTTGNFELDKLRVIEGDEKEIKGIISGITRYSNHPISQSLHTFFSDEQPLAFATVREVKGRGMEGEDASGNTYLLGSYKIAEKLTDDDTHQTYLVKNGVLIATINLIDEIRPEALTLIDYLKDKGVRPILLSGDSTAKCKEVAERLGITDVYAEQLPEQKLAVIEKLSQEAQTAMVGDGINDAPALAKAHIGISLSQATDVAIQSAQIILLNGNLGAITTLYQLGKHTLKTIRQNLFWAFFYNVLAIPVAAVGLLSPIIAALAMAFSDVIVVGNSLRLRVKSLTD